MILSIIEYIDSDLNLKESKSNMIDSQILLQEFMTNEYQELISESISELAIDELTNELTRTSTRSNKRILTSTKFKDKNFNKKSKQTHMMKLTRNINFDDENESIIMQEAINHPTREKQ